MWRPIFDPGRGRGALPPTFLSPTAAKIRHSTKVSSRRQIQAPVHIWGCNRTSRHSYGYASANSNSSSKQTRQWLVAAQRSPAVTSLLATASLCPIAASPPSVYTVCLQCYLNARWELVIGVARIPHSSLGFVAALAWAFANFILASWLGWDPLLGGNPSGQREGQWSKPTCTIE